MFGHCNLYVLLSFWLLKAKQEESIDTGLTISKLPLLNFKLPDFFFF